MLLWSGEALSALGSQASTVAFPLLVLALTRSPAKAGIVGLAKWAPVAAAALPAGLLADRFDRKRLMLGSDLVRALLMASIPLALWLGRPPFAQLAAVAFADGCLFTLRYVCERGVLPRVVPSEQLPDAVAQNEARIFAAGIAGPLGPEQEEYVRTIHAKGEQLLRLIMGLLDLSKLESGTMSLRQAPAQIGPILKDVISTLTPAARKKEVDLELDAENLPCELAADAERLRQVFINLVDNAVKFTPKGGKVTVRSRVTEPSARSGG